MLVAVAASPHGSSTNWQILLLAEVGGRLHALRQKPFEVWSRDGLFIGDLGSGRGVGVAVWKFLWDDCHACPSRYAVEFYPWSAPSAGIEENPTGTLETQQRFGTGIEALRSLGLPYTDTLRDFEQLAPYR